jgi:hypothetical protein
MWLKGSQVERKDTGERGTLTGEGHYGYSAVMWSDGSTTWIRDAMLRLVEVQLS